MIDDKYRIGNFINKLRKEKSMTQTELGKKIGVTNKAVSKWEVGENSPDSSLFPIISKIFEVTVDELYRGERNNSMESSEKVEKEYLKSIQVFRRDINIIFIILISYILYFFILQLIKPIKLSTEYINDVRILFDIFIPIFIYLTASAMYTIIYIQEIIQYNLNFRRKATMIVLLILLFFISMIPILIFHLIMIPIKRKKYTIYLNKQQSDI